MKKLFVMLLILPATLAMYQPNMADITRALSSGNADALGQFFGSTVEIALTQSEDRYNKAEAVKVLKTFFAQNQPKGFTQVHKGVSKGGNLHYCIGEMQTNNSTFRVYLLLADGPSQYQIQQLRIDKE